MHKNINEPADLRRAPHQPVLYQQVIDILQPHARGRYVDGTLGAGGHAAGILESSQPDGKLLGLDVDAAALTIAGKRLSKFTQRVFIHNGSYGDLLMHLDAIGWKCVNGIILDLGVSSMQMDQVDRGFSFSKDAPLDMRFDTRQKRTAADVVNQSDEAELAVILREYGEEPSARRIAAAIVAHRPIHMTAQLAKVIEQAVRRPRGRINPATRSFQALRIAVNQELEVLEKGLQQAVQALCPGGRMAVISFHSLEDRLIKLFFQRESRGCICPADQPVCTCTHQASLRVLTKKVIKPTLEEKERNPRARSAKMRAAEKM